MNPFAKTESQLFLTNEDYAQVVASCIPDTDPKSQGQYVVETVVRGLSNKPAELSAFLNEVLVGDNGATFVLALSYFLPKERSDVLLANPTVMDVVGALDILGVHLQVVPTTAN